MEYVSRCPACSALVRPGQDWCTLCHADLRPPELRPTAEAPGMTVDAQVDPLEAALSVLLADHQAVVDPEPTVAASVAALGKHARHAAPEPAAAAVAEQEWAQEASPAAAPTKVDDVEIAALIARLAAESPNPIGGIMSRLPESQPMRVVLALTVGAGIALLLILVSWIFGLVFG